MVLSKLFNEYDHWIRCVIDINHHVRNALLDILHDEENGLPRDPKKLYKKLDDEYNKSKNNKLKKLCEKKLLNNKQLAILRPSCRESNSRDWDIPLINMMIRNFYKNLRPPKGGWKIESPEKDDFSLAAFLLLSGEIRNIFFHAVMEKYIPLGEYKSKKEDIRNILVGLGYKNMREFDEDDCLYTVGLADIRKLMEIESNTIYSCESCGFS